MFLTILLLKLTLISVICSCDSYKFDIGLKKNGELTGIPDYFDKSSHLLDLSGNKIINIHEFFFNEYPNLDIINMSNNKITTVNSFAFKNLTKLSMLVLDKNLIDYLPDNIFNHTKNIIEVSVNNNKLSFIKNNIFANLKFLEIIRLMDNRISTIETGSFSNLPSLKLVDLSYNLLTYMQINVVDDFKKLKNFALHGNFWNCNQNLCPVMNSVLGSENFQPQCNEERKYKKWKDLLTDFSPSIMINKSYFTEGDEVQIQCQFCFASKIFWKFNGMEINSGIIMSAENVTSTMVLKNVNVSQSGMYTCHVKDCYNCTNTGTYFLTVNKKYVVIDNSSNMNSTDVIPTIKSNTAEIEYKTEYGAKNHDSVERISDIKNETNLYNSSRIKIEDDTKIILTLENVGPDLTERNITEDISAEINQSSMSIFFVLTIFVPCVLFTLMITACTLWSRSDRKKSFSNSQEDSNLQSLLFQYISNPVPFPPPDQQDIPIRNNRTSHRDNHFRSEPGQTENRRISKEVLGVLVEIPFEENSNRTSNISHHYNFFNNEAETVVR